MNLTNSTANDSDKTISLTTNQFHVLESIYVTYSATATAGDRQLEVQAKNAAGTVVWQVRAGAVQAANTARKYFFAAGAPAASAFIDTEFLYCFMPSVFLPGNFTVRVFDNNAVDAAADDMVVFLNGYQIG